MQPDRSHAQPVTGIPPSSLARSNNLDHLPTLEPQIPCNRILGQDPRQLCLFEAIPLQQRGLFLAAEQDVLGHKLVVRNVDEQILLEKALNERELRGDGHDLAGLRGEGDGGNQNAGLEVVLGAVLDKLLHHANADRGLFRAELNPDRAALRLRVGVLRGRWRGELLDHCFAGASGELHLCAAGGKVRC